MRGHAGRKASAGKDAPWLLDALVGCQRFGDAATLQSQSWWILKVSGHSLLGGLSGLMHHKASKE